MFELGNVKYLFEGDEHKYFVTIKPPPSKIDVIHRVCEYIEKRIENYWIVKCMSINNYIHYHGIVSFKESQCLENKVLKAFHRFVNRNMGFMKIEPLSTTIDVCYRYVRAERNTCKGEYTQEDYSNRQVIDLNKI